MANKSKKKANGRSPRNPKRPRAPASSLGASLDASGAAYAKLLSDPCAAPLAHPTYSGTEGGYLIRCDSFFTVGGAAGETAGFLMFTPSLIDGNGNGVISGSGLNSASILPPVTSGGTQSPGYAFITTNAASFRPVAACMKISYPGSESARSGRIHYGQISSGAVQIGGAYNSGQYGQMVPHYERTPAGLIEIVWKPNDADQLFMTPGTTVATDSSKNNKCASLLATWAGIPSGIGLGVHLTCVYEWQPAVALGVANPNLSRSMSRNTVEEIVTYLQRTGFNFVRSTAMSATQGAAAGFLSTAYGLMAPIRQTLRLAQ